MRLIFYIPRAYEEKRAFFQRAIAICYIVLTQHQTGVLNRWNTGMTFDLVAHAQYMHRLFTIVKLHMYIKLLVAKETLSHYFE